MKHVIPFLEIGEIVMAQIVEVQEDGCLLVSFGGDLLKISNRSQSEFRAGDDVRLQVQGLTPLEFRVVVGVPGPGAPLGFDRTI